MRKILRLYLERDGYTVSVAADGTEGMAMLNEGRFDLVILDWMLPGISGIELCRHIRDYQIPSKVIMLTAKAMPDDELTGLSSGADDYIKKPFTPQILLLRIRKLLQLEQRIGYGPFQLDTGEQTVYQDGERLALTKKEFELLQLFIRNPRRIFSRDALLDHIWGMDYDGDMRTVDTHIRRLRTKIGEQRIHTHVGLGYSLE